MGARPRSTRAPAAGEVNTHICMRKTLRTGTRVNSWTTEWVKELMDREECTFWFLDYKVENYNVLSTNPENDARSFRTRCGLYELTPVLSERQALNFQQ